MNLILSTRQSPLALWQAQEAQRLIEDKHRDVDVSLLPVTSGGDKDLTTALSRFGRVGIFTAEVDSALLENRAHLGVHSLKDLTTKIEDGLCLAGVLPSGPTEDVLVTVDGRMLDELPAGSKVATSSQRRKAQLLRLRPDLIVVEIRGNVQTRLRQLEEGHADGLLMARAGLMRLGLGQRISEVFGTDKFLPAAGQGIVGLTARTDNPEAKALVQNLVNDGSDLRAEAERTFVRALDAGCTTPLGVYCTNEAGRLRLRVQLLSLDGTRELTGEMDGNAERPFEVGRDLAKELLEQGAAEMVAEARGD